MPPHHVSCHLSEVINPNAARYKWERPDIPYIGETRDRYMVVVVFAIVFGVALGTSIFGHTHIHIISNCVLILSVVYCEAVLQRHAKQNRTVVCCAIAVITGSWTSQCCIAIFEHNLIPVCQDI